MGNEAMDERNRQVRERELGVSNLNRIEMPIEISIKMKDFVVSCGKRTLSVLFYW